MTKVFFILNPAAGSGKSLDILPTIAPACKDLGVDFEIHRTVSAGDAHNFVRNKTKQAKQEKAPIRFFACGGDGTVNEVLNGFMGSRYSKAELAIIPVGSGNDFVRNLGSGQAIKDVKTMLLAPVKAIDVLKYELSGNKKGYALNVINMGFDAEAASKMQDYKGGLIRGTAAYIAGVSNVLTRQPSIQLEINIDGEEKISGKMLLAGVANGAYSGGGFHGMPEAIIDDGYLDVLTVDYISRLKFVSLVSKYYAGEHLKEPKLRDIVHHFRGETVQIKAESDITLAIDGEIVKSDILNVEVRKKAVKIAVAE
jgi:YegS/Rv2252/BmrU family lipid kinase